MKEVKKKLQTADLILRIIRVLILIAVVMIIGVNIGMNDAVKAMTNLPPEESWPWYWHISNFQWNLIIGILTTTGLGISFSSRLIYIVITNLEKSTSIETAPPMKLEGAGMQG